MPKFELTDEQKKWIEKDRREVAELRARGLPEPVGPLADRMQSEAEASAALAQPGPIRDAYLEIFPEDAEDDA